MLEGQRDLAPFGPSDKRQTEVLEWSLRKACGGQRSVDRAGAYWPRPGGKAWPGDGAGLPS